jgi:putative copper resistance protein D
MLTTQLIIARGAHIAASILIAGTFTFDIVTLGLTGRSVSNELREVERRLFRLAVWSLLAAFLSALLWFWLEVASMNELSLKDAFSMTAWQTVLFETQFGRVWQLRLPLIVAAFVLVASALAQLQARRALIVVLWLASVVSLISLAWISHAAAATVHPFGVLGDMLHLCAAGVWIGGLVPLLIFLARTRASVSLGEMVPRVLRRFSTLSLCCVSVLVASGISNSWLLVGSIYALFTTPYGRLLLIKLMLFAIVLGFGARNRLIIKTNVLKTEACSDVLLQLRRNVIREACLGAAVVAIVACLGVTPPSRHP